MKYKIGEVSKILGISTDLLRYYERKGIVTPEKDRSNDYRYYSVEDTNYLIDCLYYKNLGFSLDQTAALVHDSTVDELDRQLLQNEQRLEEQLLHTKMLLEHSRRQRKIMADLPRLLGSYSRCRRPAMLYYTHRQDRDYLRTPQVYAASQEWLNYLPFARRTFRIQGERDVSPADAQHFQWGFALPIQAADRLSVHPGGPVELLSECPCVYTVISNAGESFSPALLHPCMEQLTTQGLQLNGPVYGSLITSARSPDSDSLIGYYEVWLPVEEE